jgi:nucleotide-binding universal stress UspA family protein
MGSEGFDKAIEKIPYEKFEDVVEDERIQTVVRCGDPGETILKTATDLNVDTIVMGTKGRRGFELILAGSAAQKVLRNTTITLLIIPTKSSKLESGTNSLARKEAIHGINFN